METSTDTIAAEAKRHYEKGLALKSGANYLLWSSTFMTLLGILFLVMGATIAEPPATYTATQTGVILTILSLVVSVVSGIVRSLARVELNTASAFIQIVDPDTDDQDEGPSQEP